MTESDLIRKAQEGDESALAELFTKNISDIRGVAFKILKNEEDAEEMASDAFMKGIKTFDPGKGAKFSTWLYKLTTNACISKLRKQKPEPEEEWVTPKKGHKGRSVDESLEEFMDANTVVEWLQDKDGNLSPQNVEDFYRTQELNRKEEEYKKEGVNLFDEFLKHPIPGQSVYDWYEDDGSWRVLLTWGDHWHLFGVKWDGPNEPPELDKIRKRLKGIPKKAIAKKEGKSTGAVYTTTHRLRKKIKK